MRLDGCDSLILVGDGVGAFRENAPRRTLGADGLAQAAKNE